MSGITWSHDAGMISMVTLNVKRSSVMFDCVMLIRLYRDIPLGLAGAKYWNINNNCTHS